MDYSMELPKLTNASNVKEVLLEYSCIDVSMYYASMYEPDNKSLYQLIEENRDFKYPDLHRAARHGNIRLLERYLSAEIDINRRGTSKDHGLTPLQEAVANNHLNAVAYLIASGAQINAPCDTDECYGYCSTFTVAILKQPQNLKMIKFLLKHGADPNYSCNRCWKPLVLAIFSKHEKIAKVLLKYNADVNLPPYNDCYGGQVTPLQMAVVFHHLEMARLLLDNNANVNALLIQTKITPFHKGIPHGSLHPEILERILNAGLDVNVEQSFKGDTILEQAERKYYGFTSNIKNHLVKMKAADFYLSKKNLQAIDSPEFSELLSSCCKEIDLMKKCRVAHTRVTFYDLLCIQEQVVALKFKGVRQKNILNYRDKFPLYCGMIDYRLKRVLLRQNRLKKVDRFFEDVFWSLLPNTFIKNISSNLAESDVLELSEQL